MAATQKPRATKAAGASVKADSDRLDRIAQTLEAAQKDLSLIGGSVGTGVRDLRRDVSRLLRDARRDLNKMRRAVQRDVERLQKDVTSGARPTPTRAQRAPSSPARTVRRGTASSPR